jgi:DNA polymerase I-like protein with 3'-5' exonuclease and polymerase domains
MGMTKSGLSVELRKNGVQADEDDAQRWLDETMALYAKVPEYQDQKGAEAARMGYVRCLSGRIRYIGGIRSRDEYTREEAKRFAFSTPIQEGAQYLMKMAEVRLYQNILVPYWRQGRWVEPLLQVHDALLLECEDDPALAYDLHAKMVTAMTTTPEWFTVPTETSGDWGYSWADMESFS